MTGAGRRAVAPGAGLALLAAACGPSGAGTVADFDGDGVPDVNDCDADDPDTFPGADDPCGDGLDQDCDGVDGVTGTWCGGDADWIHLSSAGGWEAVAAGGDRTCGLRDGGHLACWGRGLEVDSEPVWREVAAGTNAMCGLLEDGAVSCWVLGSDFPSPPAETLAGIGLGAWDAVGIRDDGALVRWGSPSNGELAVPVPDGAFDRVTVGGGQACARDEGDGGWTCWGTDTDALPGDGPWRDLVAGQRWSCGIDEDDAVRCFGMDAVDGLVEDERRWVSLGEPEAGWHVCALDEGGEVGCWGSNEWRQTDAPQGRFTSLATGLFHSCGVLRDGRVACWGHGQFGEEFPP